MAGPMNQLIACGSLNSSPQDEPMASALVRTVASDRKRCLSCECTEECYSVLCWRMSRFSCLGREEKASNGRIVEILVPHSTEQTNAGCYKRESKVEISIALPSVPRYSTGRSPDCTDANPRHACEVGQFEMFVLGFFVSSGNLQISILSFAWDHSRVA